MFYFINNQAADNGSHEVHRLGCKRMPSDKAYLGNFEHVHEALMEARKEFWSSVLCKACSDTRPLRPDTIRVGNLLFWSPGR